MSDEISDKGYSTYPVIDVMYLFIVDYNLTPQAKYFQQKLDEKIHERVNLPKKVLIRSCRR